MVKALSDTAPSTAKSAVSIATNWSVVKAAICAVVNALSCDEVIATT